MTALPPPENLSGQVSNKLEQISKEAFDTAYRVFLGQDSMYGDDEPLGSPARHQKAWERAANFVAGIKGAFFA